MAEVTAPHMPGPKADETEMQEHAQVMSMVMRWAAIWVWALG